MRMKKKIIRNGLAALVALAIVLPLSLGVFAAADLPFLPGIGIGDAADDPSVDISINGSGSDAVRVLLLLTILTLIPSILLMMTCFTRIVIVFSLLRNAIGLQQTPPNQVIIGLALFLSLFIMAPVMQQINETAYRPFSEGEIDSQEFLDRAEVPVKEFMLKQILDKDMQLFVELSKIDIPDNPADYPLTTVIPAFITSELKRAFTVGFFIFIPFLIIDMVVSSTLMSMGMMMLPPITISLPFKLMLFVLADGWGLLIRVLAIGYR